MAPHDAQLALNGEYVGDVVLQRREDSWAHGLFYPTDAFAKYAPLFGRWSLLMHADGEFEPLSDAARDELRQTEADIDRLCATLHFIEGDHRVNCLQLNIDAGLIEWKSA
jgi:hypothetical protein